MQVYTDGKEEGETETCRGDPSWRSFLWVGLACSAACKNWRQDSGGGSMGKNEEKRWLGSIDETDWAFVPPLRMLLVPVVSCHPPELRPIRASSAPSSPPWLYGPSVPLTRADARVGCAVCMPFRVGPPSQGKAVHADLVLGFSPLGFSAGEGWLAGSWADERGTMDRECLKVGPLFSLPLPPPPPFRCSLFRGFL